MTAAIQGGKDRVLREPRHGARTSDSGRRSGEASWNFPDDATSKAKALHKHRGERATDRRTVWLTQ